MVEYLERGPRASLYLLLDLVVVRGVVVRLPDKFLEVLSKDDRAGKKPPRHIGHGVYEDRKQNALQQIPEVDVVETVKKSPLHRAPIRRHGRLRLAFRSRHREQVCRESSETVSHGASAVSVRGEPQEYPERAKEPRKGRASVSFHPISLITFGVIMICW